MNKKNDFFLIAPLPFWGCVSIWLSNLARLTPESAVPYAWAALFFSYGIVALYYIQMAISFKSCSNSPKSEVRMDYVGNFDTIFSGFDNFSYSIKEGKVSKQEAKGDF